MARFCLRIVRNVPLRNHVNELSLGSAGLHRTRRLLRDQGVARLKRFYVRCRNAVLAVDARPDEPDERDGIYATLCGLLYALAPFAYNQMIAGDQSALIANALSPIAIALAVRAMFAEGRMWWAFAIGSSLMLMIVVASAQVFLFTAAIMWIVCFVLVASWRSILRLGVVTAGAIALCSFWILPAFLGGGAVHTVVQTASPDRAFATYEQFSNPILTLATIGFPGDFIYARWDRPAA